MSELCALTEFGMRIDVAIRNTTERDAKDRFLGTGICLHDQRLTPSEE